MNHAISVGGLRKVYGHTVAVDGVSFEVRRGEIFGMVGPNGAGKTTTIECVEGLRHPDGGVVTVLGLDPRRDGYELRGRLGIQLQQSALQDRLKVWEAMDLFSALAQHPVPWEPLLEQLGLSESRDRAFGKLSGGQKQRLFIALSLINDPDLVFLDELTTGLDPQARRAMWELVLNVREQGKTVFLTTHYMEEAEYLCDRVAIMDHGRLAALDTPDNLVRGLGDESRLVFTPREPLDPHRLTDLPSVTEAGTNGDEITVRGRGPSFVADVVNALTAQQVSFRRLRTEEPTLEDVFLSLTGRDLRS